jgi:integrase
MKIPIRLDASISLSSFPCTITLLPVPETSMVFRDFDEYERCNDAPHRAPRWRGGASVWRDDRARVARRRSLQAAPLRRAVGLERAGDDTQGRTTTAVRPPHDPTRGCVPRSSASAESQRAVPGRRPAADPAEVQYRVLRASRRAKLSQDGVHILRHTFCSHLAMRGAPPRVIQEFAGHRELGMTQRYMHLSPAALDSAIRLLDQPAVLQSLETFWRREGSPKERSMARTT